MAPAQMAALAQDAPEKIQRNRKRWREEGQRQTKGHRLPILRCCLSVILGTFIILSGHGSQKGHQMVGRFDHDGGSSRDQTDLRRWRIARPQGRTAKLKQEEEACCKVRQIEEIEGNEADPVDPVSREYGSKAARRTEEVREGHRRDLRSNSRDTAHHRSLWRRHGKWTRDGPRSLATRPRENSVDKGPRKGPFAEQTGLGPDCCNAKTARDYAKADPGLCCQHNVNSSGGSRRVSHRRDKRGSKKSKARANATCGRTYEHCRQPRKESPQRVPRLAGHARLGIRDDVDVNSGVFNAATLNRIADGKTFFSLSATQISLSDHQVCPYTTIRTLFDFTTSQKGIGTGLHHLSVHVFPSWQNPFLESMCFLETLTLWNTMSCEKGGLGSFLDDSCRIRTMEWVESSNALASTWKHCALVTFQNVFEFVIAPFWMISVSDFAHLGCNHWLAIFAVILSDVIDYPVDLLGRRELLSHFGTGWHQLTACDIDEIANHFKHISASFMMLSWLDLDQDIVKGIRTSLLAHLIAVVLFGICMGISCVKGLLYMWKTKRVNACRFCGKKRVPTRLRKSRACAFPRTLIFASLLLSTHAQQPLRNCLLTDFADLEPPDTKVISSNSPTFGMPTDESLYLIHSNIDAACFLFTCPFYCFRFLNVSFGHKHRQSWNATSFDFWGFSHETKQDTGSVPFYVSKCVFPAPCLVYPDHVNVRDDVEPTKLECVSTHNPANHSLIWQAQEDGMLRDSTGMNMSCSSILCQGGLQLCGLPVPISSSCPWRDRGNAISHGEKVQGDEITPLPQQLAGIPERLTFLCHEQEQPHATPESDMVWLMQTNPHTTRGLCGRHTDPRMYWDRLSYRPAIITNRFLLWYTDTTVIGVLQQEVHTIPWDGTMCVRCAATAAMNLQDNILLRGPYYIRPQPLPIGGPPVLQFLMLTVPKLDQQRAVHVTVHTPSRATHGTLVLNTISGIVAIPQMFDQIVPANRCRTTSWCRITQLMPNGLFAFWWPYSFTVDDFAHIELEEFESQPLSTQIRSAPAPSQGMICQSRSLDPGSTSYDDDTNSLLQAMTSITNDDEVTLMHLPFATSDRSRSDGSLRADNPEDHSHSSPNSMSSDGGHEDLTALVLYGLEMEHKLIPIDHDTPSDVYRVIALNSLGLQHDLEEAHAFAIHPIQPKPKDLADCIIPMMATFRGQNSPMTSVVLIDLELYSNQPAACRTDETEPSTLRESWKLPVSLTRAAFLQWIGVKELCKRIIAPCVVHYGYHPWFQQDPQEMPILNGLFLRVQIPIMQPQMPLQFYVHYARDGIALASMHDHWQQQQQNAAARMREMFDTDDELVSHAVAEATIPTHEISDDLSGLMMHSMLIRTKHLHDEDSTSFMTWETRNIQGRRVTASNRQVFVIYEFENAPVTVTMDPSMTTSTYRHAIGTLMEIDQTSTDWENFLIFPVRPRPSHLDPLTHECYLLVTPQQIRSGFVHLVVRLQLFWDQPDCHRTEEHMEIRVIVFPQMLDRESFLVNAHFKDLCVSEGHDRSELHVAGKLWPTTDFETRYLFDGMYASIRCPTSIRHVPLQVQMQHAREHHVNQLPIRPSRSTADDSYSLDLMQRTFTLQPFRSSTIGLPPPGNGGLDTLDKVTRNALGQWETTDWTSAEEAPRCLCLTDLLSLPTPMQQDRMPKKPISLIQLVEEGPLPNATQYQVLMPQLETLVDALMSKPCQRQVNFDAWHALLPEENRTEFRRLCLDAPNHLESVEVYTDGSYRTTAENKSCTWAFIAMGHTQEEKFLLGYGYGPVVIDPLEPGWTGAKQQGSRQAELEAQIHGLEWLLRMSYDKPTSVVYDSQAAGMVAQGAWAVPPGDLQALLLRNLACGLRASLEPCPPCEWRHVRSHTRCLGNEMADSLALLAAQTDSSCGGYQHVDYMPHLMGTPPTIQWLWLAFTVPTPDSPLPYRSTDAFCFDSREANLEPQAKITSAFEHRLCPHEEEQIKSLQLHLVTFNVCTLRRKRSFAPNFMPQYLREQVALHEVNILFLQETRANNTTMLQSQTHIRLVSAASNGQGGVEIWLLRRHPKTHRPFCFANQVVVLYADAETLLVKVDYNGLKLLLLNGHAPHTGRNDSDIRTYWKHLNDLCLRFATPEYSLIVGLDANAHFQWELLPHVGPHGLEATQNLAARLFGNLLQARDLFLPTTFAELHEGESWTWTSPANGQHSRCDYLALPRSWREMVHSSWRSTTIDNGGNWKDHLPVHVFVPVQYQVKTQSKCPPKFDRQALDRAPIHELRNLFADTPIPSWDVDIDTHFVAFANVVQQKLCDKFPVQKFQPKKSFITPEIWHLRFERIQLGHALYRAKQRLAKHSLTWAFQRWRYSFGWSYSHSQQIGLLTFFRIRSQQHCAHLLTKKLHQLLRQCRISYLENIAERADNMQPRDFFQAMRQIGVAGKRYQRGFRPLPILHDAEGKVLETKADIGNRWREFFAQQEAGEASTLHDISRKHAAQLRHHTKLPQWNEIPSLLDLEAQFRHCQPLRAIFDDGMPGELFHRLPGEMARLLYPLLLKISLYQQEPFMCKGGLLVPAWKGKGSFKECSSHRSLFVSSVFGKVVHGLYRKALIHHLDGYGLPLQIGGKPGKSTTQATQALISVNYLAKKKHWNVAFLFLDVQNAFYKVLREHLFAPEPTQGFRRLFDSLKLPDGSYEEFLQLLDTGSALNQAGASEHLQAMIKQFLNTTWFVVADCPTITHTTRGTRPGDSLADITYSFVLAKILRLFFDTHFVDDGPELYWTGTHTPYGESGSIPLGPVCPIWADDVAIALLHRDAEQLMYMTKSVSVHVFELLSLAGMEPNLKPSKTEVLLALRGKQSKVMLRQLMQDDSTIQLDSCFAFPPLRIVGTYKHLGTWIACGGKLLYEIRTKIGQAHSVMTKYRTQVFACRKLPLKRKTQLFRSLVLSGVLHNAGAWHVLSGSELNCFQRGIYGLYGRLARSHWHTPALHWSNDRLCVELGLESPLILLRATRLRYIQHLIRSGEPQLWGLLQQDPDWWNQIYDDVSWLFQLVPWSPMSCMLPRDWELFSARLRVNGGAWKGTVKKGIILQCQYDRLHVEWRAWHEAIILRIKEARLLPYVTTGRRSAEAFCPCCQRPFASKAAWAVHAFKVHGRTTPARLVADGSQCSSCLKQYDSYVSLVHHLRYSLPCFARLFLRPDRPQLAPGLNSRHEVRTRHELKCPYVRAEGPIPKQDETPATPREPEMLRLCTLWTEAWHDAATVPLSTTLERFRQIAATSFLTGDLLRHAMHQWLLDTAEDESATVDILVAHDFQFRCAPDWFFETDKPTVEPEWPELLQQWAVARSPINVQVPREPCYRPVIVAHLFSGHRRPDDIQSIVESWTGDMRGAIALSVDIIFSVQHGDLMQVETQELFRRAVRERVIHGIVAGPPCESWSVARTQEDHGPRPLRDIHALHGLPGLTVKELRQVLIGNGLLGASMLLFLEALLAGVFMLIEHPEEPYHKPLAASIWRLDVVALLLRFSTCALYHVQQGFYGAASAKPTAFLVANGTPDAMEIMEVFKVRRVLPAHASIGKDATGTWRTAALKAYPAALCRAIVAVLQESVRSLRWSDDATTPAWFSEAVEVLNQSFNFDASMGPDFAGCH